MQTLKSVAPSPGGAHATEYLTEFIEATGTDIDAAKERDDLEIMNDSQETKIMADDTRESCEGDRWTFREG